MLLDDKLKYSILYVFFQLQQKVWRQSSLPLSVFRGLCHCKQYETGSFNYKSTLTLAAVTSQLITAWASVSYKISNAM